MIYYSGGNPKLISAVSLARCKSEENVYVNWSLKGNIDCIKSLAYSLPLI
jgi:hypothetical protein